MSTVTPSLTRGDNYIQTIKMRIRYYYVYILLCADGSYYTGVSNDPDRRLFEHNEGIDEGCYTFKRRPVKLMYSCAFSDPMEAIELEKQIKDGQKRKKRRWSKAILIC
jgi:putative endonuclease